MRFYANVYYRIQCACRSFYSVRCFTFSLEEKTEFLRRRSFSHFYRFLNSCRSRKEPSMRLLHPSIHPSIHPLDAEKISLLSPPYLPPTDAIAERCRLTTVGNLFALDCFHWHTVNLAAFCRSLSKAKGAKRRQPNKTLRTEQRRVNAIVILCIWEAI